MVANVSHDGGTGTRRLLRGGHILSMDAAVGEVAGGDLLVEGERIAYVGPRLAADVDAEVVDVTGHIVLPGFVDGHRHTWEALLRGVSLDWTFANYYEGLRGRIARHYRAEDLYAANLLGMLDALDAGVTTMLDWCHNINTPEHADAAIAALRESRGRAVFAYGNSNDEWLPVSDVPHSHDAWRIRTEYFNSDDGRVTMAFGPRGPEYTTAAVTRHDFELARELGLRMSVSVGDGEWGRKRPVAQLLAMGLLGPDVGHVHCSTLADDEYRMIADSGGTTVMSPDIEMQMWGFPATARLRRAGLTPALSVDCTTSISGDLFGVMRTTLGAQRALDHEQADPAGPVPETLSLTGHDVLTMATVAGAEFCGLLDRIGTLTPGKRADVVCIDTRSVALAPLNNPVGTVVLQATRADVRHVLVDGEFVKRDHVLVDRDVPALLDLVARSRDHVLEAAGVPVGTNWIPGAYVARGTAG
jgi:cytosine/adenosine deaminase-related metal-dependent hydrolase